MTLDDRVGIKKEGRKKPNKLCFLKSYSIGDGRQVLMVIILIMCSSVKENIFEKKKRTEINTFTGIGIPYSVQAYVMQKKSSSRPRAAEKINENRMFFSFVMSLPTLCSISFIFSW